MLKKLRQAWKKAPNKGSLVFLVIVAIILFVFVMLRMWDSGFSALVIWVVGTVDVGIWHKIAWSIATFVILGALVYLFYRLIQRYGRVGHYGWGRLKRRWWRIPQKEYRITLVIVAMALFIVPLLLWIWSPRFSTLFNTEVGAVQRLGLSAITFIVVSVIIYLLFNLIQHYESVKKKPAFWSSLSVAFAFVVFIITLSLIWGINGGDASILSTRLTLTVGAIGATSLSVVGILNLFANYRRASASEKRQSQELFVNSIQNLGSKEEIIRIGAIQGLGQLAKDSPEAWNDKVAEILCAYVKNTTGKSDYQTQYSSKPSDEITVLMKTLTRLDSKFDASKFDLTETYLAGLKLNRPNLECAKLNESVLIKAQFEKANLVGVRLAGVDLSGASLFRANLTGAMLNSAKLTGALLNRANLTEAWLLEANLTNAELKAADMTGALLGETILHDRYRESVNQINFSHYWSNMSETWNLSSDPWEAQSEIFEQVNKWVFTDPRKLTEEDLKFTLREAANLTGANLLSANLKRAELTKVVLNGTNMSLTELEGSNSLSEIKYTRNHKYTFWKDRVGKPPSLSGCIFKDGEEKINLYNVSCGKFTQGLYNAMSQDEGTDKRNNERRYREKHSVFREPTQEEKEQLVGKENVDKCIWGTIRVLEG